MSDELEEARILFAAAERDRLTFALLMESGRAPHENLGFLAQQACEKFLKAAMIAAGVRYERTHDLEWLASSARTAGLAIPVEDAALRSLNPYAVAARYEASSVMWVAPAEAEILIERLCTWAREALGEIDN